MSLGSLKDLAQFVRENDAKNNPENIDDFFNSWVCLGGSYWLCYGQFQINELNNQSVTDAAKDALIKTTDSIGNGLKTVGGWFS